MEKYIPLITLSTISGAGGVALYGMWKGELKEIRFYHGSAVDPRLGRGVCASVLITLSKMIVKSVFSLSSSWG